MSPNNMCIKTIGARVVDNVYIRNYRGNSNYDRDIFSHCILWIFNFFSSRVLHTHVYPINNLFHKRFKILTSPTLQGLQVQLPLPYPNWMIKPTNHIFTTYLTYDGTCLIPKNPMQSPISIFYQNSPHLYLLQ